MKLILLVFSILSIFLPSFNKVLSNNSIVEDKKEIYLTEINNAYKKYNVNEYTNPYYTVIVVEGICNEVSSYGIFLSSYEAGSYFIKISIDGVMYRVNEDNRDDTLYYALRKSNHKITIYVYDDFQGVKTKRWEYTLSDNVEYLQFGMDNGCDFNKLILNDVLFVLKHVGLILLGIIALIIITILLMYINKFGLFNPNRKKNKLIVEDKINNETYVINYEKDVKQNNDNITSEFDIKKHLIEKDYKTDYSLMSEEEKNNVMILLMSLKYQGIINDEQYESEVVKLWKK